MTLTPLPESAFAKADQSVTVSIMAWCGIVSGAMGCIGIASALISAHAFPSLGILLGSPIALVAAIGLRSRRNWARLSYVGALALSVGGLVFRSLSGHGPGLFFILGGALINGLFIAKLCSQDVRAEFDAL